MIISCPSCETRYALDPKNLGAAGRRVKCARCGHVWHQTPPEDAEPIMAPTVETPPREEAPASPLRAAAPPPRNLPAKPRTGPSRTALAVWTSAALLVVALLTGLLLGRDQVAAAWPAAGGVYRALGLDVATIDVNIVNTGPEIIEMDAELIESNEGIRLRAWGVVANPTDGPRAIPDFRVELQDQARQSLEYWTVPFERETLEPGEAITFEAYFADPDPATAYIAVAVGGVQPQDG